MRNEKFVAEWLRRAKSNLERAKAGRICEDILYEDLCFDCQQAVEKALKALLISINREFPPTHSIARLLELIEDTGINIPDEVKNAVELTDYAVKARYPGEMEPVTEEEYKRAIKIAETVFEWVKGLLACLP